MTLDYYCIQSANEDCLKWGYATSAEDAVRIWRKVLLREYWWDVYIFHYECDDEGLVKKVTHHNEANPLLPLTEDDYAVLQEQQLRKEHFDSL